MKSKSPDTRNKLDGNKDLNKKVKKKLNKNNFKNIQNTLKAIETKEALDKDPNVIKIKIVALKESKGSLYKKANGFSKTLKRNMKKIGLNPVKESIVEYKEIKKKKKLERRKKEKTQLLLNQQYRRAHPRKKKGKKNKSTGIKVTTEIVVTGSSTK